MSSAKILSSERKIVIYSFTFRELLSQKKPSFVKNGKSTTSHEELELKWRNYVYQTLHGSDAPRVVDGRVCAFLISAKQRVEMKSRSRLWQPGIHIPQVVRPWMEDPCLISLEEDTPGKGHWTSGWRILLWEFSLMWKHPSRTNGPAPTSGGHSSNG